MNHLSVLYADIKDSMMDAFIIPQARRDAKKMADRAQSLSIRMDGSKSRVRPIHALNYFHACWMGMSADDWGKHWGSREGSPYYVPKFEVPKKPAKLDYYYYRDMLARRKIRHARRPVYVDKLSSSVTDEQLEALSSKGTAEAAAGWAQTREKSLAAETAVIKAEEDRIAKIVQEYEDMVNGWEKKREERLAAQARKQEIKKKKKKPPTW